MAPDRLPKNVAGADVFQPVAPAQEGGLGALAAARRPEKDETHGWPVSLVRGPGRTAPVFISSRFILGNDKAARKGGVHTNPKRERGTRFLT